jgi:hypothetical protein
MYNDLRKTITLQVSSNIHTAQRMWPKLGHILSHILQAAQHYTTQAAFQVWPPKAEVTNCTPDDGHVGAQNMLRQ